MAIQNRETTLPGIWAENAQTDIPTPPVAGVTYRDTTLNSTAIDKAWPFKTIVDSSDFNQHAFLQDTLIKESEQYGIMRWNNTTRYKEGGFCLGQDGNLYQALRDNQGKEPTSSTDDWKVFTSGGGLEIGDIGFAPLGVDETENKRRYLNGQVISQAQFVSFTNKIKAAIQLYPNLATSETNWQAEVTNSKLGQCGKFVIDNTAGTIRLPKVVNINGLTDLSLMGSIKAESLPNIRGEFRGTNAWNGDGPVIQTGALYSKGNLSRVNGSQQSGYNTYSLNFDASRSSSTYQDGAPVQQEAVQYPYFIQVATGTEESVDVTREIELNNPFSLLDYKWSEYELNNASWLLSNGAFHSGATYVAVYELLLKIHNGTETKDGVSVKLSTEAYTDTDFVINTADTTFRLPIKVKLASGNAVVGNGMTLGLTNGTTNYGLASSDAAKFGGAINQYGRPVGITQSNNWQPTGGEGYGVTTDPTKSGLVLADNNMYLYFYVGETIQDANVINAAGVLTEVASLKAHSIVETYVNGTSGYRVWSDGYCEQWGYTNASSGTDVSISLLKTMKNIDYFVDITPYSTSGNTAETMYRNKTTVSVAIRGYGTFTGLSWMVTGYIA